MNKKGFLLGEETLKIIIAVICICFLVYLLTMLYFAHINKEKQIQAERIVKGAKEGSIKIAIEKVEQGKGGQFDGNAEVFLLTSPTGWYLFSFTENKKPNSCLGENCLCVCDNVVDVLDRQIKSCDKTGTCLTVKNLEKFNEIEISANPIKGILIKKESGKIIIGEVLDK